MRADDATGQASAADAAERTSPPSQATPAALAESIARLRRALRRAARAADPENQLTVAQLELLACLAEHPAARPGQLARLLRLRPNTVTTLVNALTGEQMISRETSDDDRRGVTLRITDAGRQAVRDFQATNGAVLADALATLPAEQRRSLRRAVPALDALAAAVDRLAEAGGSAER
ncbi:MAG TPA: MarR family transcriptional regulator [Micromonosporaceae bacterium]